LDLVYKSVVISKINIVLILLAFYLSCTFAEAPDTLWTKIYGGLADDEGSSVQQTTDGGFIVVGNTYLNGAHDKDIYIIKTTAQGNTVWEKTYGGAYHDLGVSVQEDNDGCYLIAGNTCSFGAGRTDVYLIKVDVNGDTLWTKTYGGTGDDMGYSIEKTNDGGYIIAGATSSMGLGIPNFLNVYLIKINKNGDTLWTRTYGGVYPDIGRSVQQISDGGYIIAGYKKDPFPGDWDVYVIKTDESGDTLWTKTYGGTGNDQALSVQETSDSGYIFVGSTSSHEMREPHFYIIKADVNGDTLWTKEHASGKAYSVQQTSDGEYIIVGSIWSSAVGCHVVSLVKISVKGDTIWTRMYGCGIGYTVQESSDKGYVIVGTSKPFHRGRDVYFIKTKPDID
jgi:hypothetical protein